MVFFLLISKDLKKNSRSRKAVPERGRQVRLLELLQGRELRRDYFVSERRQTRWIAVQMPRYNIHKINVNTWAKH